MIKNILFIVFIQYITVTCRGSEEIPLPIGSVDLRGWSEVAGGVRIQIDSSKGSIESVKISAFGRDIAIPDHELAKLKNVIYSEISISHGGGYKNHGNHKVFFNLKFRDMFGGDPFKGDSLLEERVKISVPMKGPVVVFKERVKIE